MRLKQYPGAHTGVMALLALLILVAEQVNGRFWLNDFRVYYGAAQALLAGEPLYGVAHGLDTGVFKYAPVMAMLFVPQALLPYPMAATIQFTLIAAAFIAGMQRADRLIRQHLLGGVPGSLAALFLVTLAVVVHLHRELHLGNINMMLLWLLLLALDLLLRNKDRTAGILVGIAVLAKPHFAVLLPLLVLRQRYTALTWAAVSLGVGLALPALALGLAKNVEVHQAWLEQMARHNAALIYTGGEGYEAVNTLYSFVHRALLHPLGIAAGTPTVMVLLGLVALGMAVLVLGNRRSTIGEERALTLEYLVLVALVPSLTLTDTEHFLLAMPLVLYAVIGAMDPRTPRILAWATVPVLLAYGGNWEDLLGPLSDRYVHHGVLGIANVALIVLAVLLCRSGSNQGAGAASNA